MKGDCHWFGGSDEKNAPDQCKFHAPATGETPQEDQQQPCAWEAQQQHGKFKSKPTTTSGLWGKGERVPLRLTGSNLGLG